MAMSATGAYLTDGPLIIPSKSSEGQEDQS
jgi:hypothetical protein